MASSSKEAQKRDAYNTAVFNFDWDTLQRKSWHAYQQYTDKTWNDKVIKDYEHSLKVSAWQDAAAIRHFKYANQREAHNASVKAYNKQLDYNELAEKISLNDSTRKYNERLTEIGFQNEDLLMNFNHTKLAKGLSLRELQEQKNLKSKAIAIGLRDAVDEANLNASRSLLELDKAKADAARKGVDLTIESLHQQGKVRAMGRTGRSARKTLQGVLAGHGRGQAALVEMITVQERDNKLAFDGISKKLASAKASKGLDYMTLAMEVDQLQRRSEKEIGMKKETTGAAQRQLQESLKSAAAQKDADDMTTGLQRWSADMSAEAQIAPDAKMEPKPTFPVKLDNTKLKTTPPPKYAEMSKDGTWKTTKAGKALREQYETLKPPDTEVIKGPSFFERIFSDDRLKYNMNRVATSKKGLPIYTFKYRFEGKNGPTYIGTSAQDLIKMGREDAVGQIEENGFYYVNYNKIDVQFTKIA